jgi:hypothetical protein
VDGTDSTLRLSRPFGFGTFQVERFIGEAVQRMMRRTKIIFAAWLPFLWLVATACGSASVSSGGAGCYPTSISAAAGRGQHDPARDSDPSRQALRNLNRRAGMSCESDGKPVPVIASAAGHPALKQVPILFSVIEAPADLVRCWQFCMRMAPDPRAPSAVS